MTGRHTRSGTDTAQGSTAPLAGTIVLAGGRGTRMGGVNKAALTVGGERFVDRLLRQLPYGVPTVVVSPYFLGVPQVCENPLFGGPAAGIARGFAELESRGMHPGGDQLVAVVAVDAPDSPQLLPRLTAALRRAPEAGAALIRSADGHLQPLCAVWRADCLAGALAAVGSPRNASAMRLIRQTRWVAVDSDAHQSERDYDTPAELRAFRQAAEY